jgi:hypothetical protein
VLLVAALAIYGVLFFILRRTAVPNGHFYAAAACAVALAVYWIWFDTSVLAEARYNLRTVLLIAIPAFGIAASIQAMNDAEWRGSPLRFLARWAAAIEARISPQALIGALLIILLVHAVETAKFVARWARYEAAVNALATGTAADPELGSPLFVSSRRIGAELNCLAWNSTTPYLSVLVAPGLAPNRLVVDPDAGYFWLSCKTARNSEAGSNAIPGTARQLVRMHACLHRQ